MPRVRWLGMLTASPYSGRANRPRPGADQIGQTITSMLDSSKVDAGRLAAWPQRIVNAGHGFSRGSPGSSPAFRPNQLGCWIGTSGR